MLKKELVRGEINRETSQGVSPLLPASPRFRQMLRLILAGSLLAIGSASLDPDGLLPDQLKQPEELPPNPNRRIPNNREAEEEVSNLLSQLEGTAAGNMTIWGENERPDGPFIRKNGTSGRKHAVFGPRNSLVTGNGTKVVPAPHDNKDFEKKLLGIEPTGKHADILNLKLFGEFGKNYFTEYGKAYINCAVSDVERPLLEAVNSTEGRTKKCFIEWGRSFERLACMAVFMYKGTAEELKNDPNPRENMVVQNQNCWNNQEAAIETCTKASKCMFNGMIEAGKQHFCCCNEHNCNDVIDYDPNATEEDDEAILEKEKLEMAEKQKRIQAIAEAQHRKVVAIIVSVFAGIAMLGLAVITFCCCRKHRNKRKENVRSAVHTELLLPNDLELGSKVDRPWEIINSSLEEIGQGKYGRVYKAQFRDRADAPLMTVAVKTYKSGNTASYHNELAIYNELCMKKCQKDCILRLIQFDLQEKLLITEYYEMGNLHQYLEKFTIEQPLDTLSLIISLLEALSFLHEERGPMSQDPKPVILHRDIKSHNVLLRVDSRNRLVGVLMDFGLSLKCSQATQDSQATTNQMHKVVGTQRYMAPELLVGSAELDIAHFKAIDVYAMALVLWEIVTRTRVTPTEEVPIYSEPLERELRKEQPNDPLKLSTYRHVVAAKKLRPSFRKAVQNDRLLSKVQNSIEEMWEHDAGCRVSAACVQKRMEVVFDEGYHSGTMDGSLRSTSSDAEKTPPSGRSSTHSDTNKTVVIEADETLSGEVEEAVDTVNEAARLLGHKNNNLPPEGEAIELEMR